MWLAITLFLAAATAALRAYGAQLHITGLWAGKALAPEGSDTIMPTGFQDALTHGWPSTVSFVSGIAPIGVFGIGFLHAWWAGFLGIAVMVMISGIVRRSGLIPMTVDRYLLALFGHLTRREADHRRDGDHERAEAAASVAERLQGLIAEYLSTGVRVPTYSEVQKWANGDRTSLMAAVLNQAV